MSRNKSSSEKRADRRIERTRDRLGDALIALILEQPFDTITVQDVLDRAGVGRSTFYTHYRDKEDLFISDIDDFWALTASALSRRGERSDRIAPVRELFEHVSHAGELLAALNESGRMHDVMELGRLHLARAIEQRFREIPRGMNIAPERRPDLAHAFAGALVALLMRWLDQPNGRSPAQMDEPFHRIVWSGA